MTDDIAIRVDNLSKIYRLYHSPLDRLKESLHPLRRRYHHDFYALKDVSFEIKKGDSVGIIGKNGSGKSTLLKILTGVLTPTSGSVTVNGRVSALLELGAGFNPELSGIDNVYFNGMLMGYSRQEMDERLDAILSFADIGEFVYQPVKTYSSGMFVRLAFAVAVNVDPDILIVDEALAVGDLRFQKKCKVKMNEFKEVCKTIVIVSHSMADLRAMCNLGCYLQQGRLLHWGTMFNAINLYSENESKFDADELTKGYTEADKLPVDNSGDIAGTGDVIVKNVKCYQEGNECKSSEIEFGKPLVIEFDYDAYMAINNPIITVNIGCTTYRVISNLSSINHNFKIDRLDGNGKIYVRILNQQFYPGAYAVHVAITSESVNVHHFMHNYAGGFIIKGPPDRLLCYPAALVQPDATFSIEAYE